MVKQHKVLVVDDDDLSLTIVQDVLQDAGYSVCSATNGIDANRHIFSTQKPDLIILDVLMPMTTGDKKTKLLRDNDSTKGIPILLMSSRPEEELQQLVKESDADGFICKPFSKERIVTAVREAIENGRTSAV